MSSNSTTTTASSTATDQSSSDKGQHSAMRKLRGVPGTTRFCVKRDGSCAFVFDYANDAFVLIDLQSGAHTLIETERPELDGAQLWSDIHLISRQTQTLILALIREGDCNYFHLVAFRTGRQKFHIADEKEVYEYQTTRKGTPVGRLQEDETGVIYCIVYWQLPEGKTVYHVRTVDIDEKGKISLTTLANDRYLNGKWLQPFICYGSLYWLPWSRDPCRKLLAVPLNSTSHSSIKVSSQIDPFLIGGSHWCWPAMIGLNVFYYLYNPKKRTGYICQLECYKKLWKVLSADMLEHTIVGHTGESMIKASPIDGRIYVHGDCTEPNCPDKAHIFVINFKRESTTHIGPKLEKMSISDSVSNHSDDLKSRSSEEPLVNLSTAHSAEKKQDQNDKALLSPTRRDIVGKPLGENAGLRRVK